MRIFSMLAAIVVTAFLYLLVFERPMLMERLGIAAATPSQAQLAADAAVRETAEAQEQARSALVKVVVQRSDAQQIDTAVVLRGQTRAARQVDLRAETSSTVVSEPLRKGSHVDAGQMLCRLDAGTRQSTLDQAMAQLDEARARVPEAQALVHQAEARLDEARINQNAAAKLSEGGFASSTRVAGSDADVATAEAALESAHAGLQGAQSGILAAEAAVASARKEIDRLTLVAPFSGVLESDTAELGALLQSGDLCGTILQLDPIKLVGFVPETEVERVAVGAPAAARLVTGAAELRGQVTFLSRSADETTRTFRVEIDVPNADLAIRDGQTAEIMIASEGARAHLLPQSALTLNDEGTLGVRTIDDSAIVEFHPVTLMRDTPEGIWVTGLADSVNVIVLGQEYVIAGVQVAPTFRELSQ